MDSLIAHIKATVKPREFYEWFFGKEFHMKTTEPREKCPWREDNNPSLHFNLETGAWFDHGAKSESGSHGRGGNSIVSFYANAEFDGDKKLAAIDLYDRFCHPIVEMKVVRRWKRNLKKVPSHSKAIQDRLVSATIIEQFNIGSDGERVTIPISDRFGNVVNVRRWMPGAKKFKMLNYENRKRPDAKYGLARMIFPYSALTRAREEGEPLFVVEGEWDALALLSMGVFAVTGTHGAKAWPTDFNADFRGVHAVICYDKDDDGKLGAKKACQHIAPYVASLRMMELPDGVGKDIGEWLKNDKSIRSRAKLLELASNAVKLTENLSLADRNVAGSVPLEDATDAAVRHGELLSVDAFVTGKTSDQYVVPTKYRVSCSGECERCPLAELNRPFKEVQVSPVSEDALAFVGSTKNTASKMMVNLAGMPCEKECRTAIEVVDRVTLEQLQITPSIADRNSKQYVTRQVWSVGHKLVPHREHRFEGALLTDPHDQRATLVFGKSTPIQTEVEAFEITPKIVASLSKFRAKGDSLKFVSQRMAQISSWQSRNVTKIVGRPEVHTVVDLAFHSLPEFVFNGDLVARGMLDVLLIGDTRTGKNQVVEGLMNYYGLGEIASGENCSFAGLVGGCESIGRKFAVRWGVIPRNHGRLVTIDESSALSLDDFGKLSRVRSEGIAEITKIVSERTVAKARLIWLSNPRGGKPLSSFSYGVESIRELVGQQEDVARFDIAIAVAASEVDSSAINTVKRAADDENDSSKFPAEDMRNLILWAWSRTKEQVMFDPEAERECLNKAMELGVKYSPEIPLIQAENARIKISKIAAAVAARLFSSDESGEILVVRRCHVEYAVELITKLYDRHSMAYDLFSARAHQRTRLDDRLELELSTLLNELGDSREDAMRAIRSSNTITKRHLAEHLGDDATASEFMRQLIRLDCLAPMGAKDAYRKTPVLTKWIRSVK